MVLYKHRRWSIVKGDSNINTIEHRCSMLHRALFANLAYQYKRHFEEQINILSRQLDLKVIEIERTKCLHCTANIPEKVLFHWRLLKL